ncbi:MAG: iron chaperone, partial [Candidatus Nanopelagicaceae bacterium]
ESPKDYFAKLEKEKAKTMRKIFSVIQKKYPKLELVISWNQPMLKNGEKYIFGCSASKNHLTIAPWDPKVLKKVAPMLEGYVVNKKTVRVPSDWTIDEKLLIAMVRENLKS